MIIVLLFALPTWMLFGGYAAFAVFCGVILVQFLMELGEERRINALKRWDRDQAIKARSAAQEQNRRRGQEPATPAR